jgi:hypothetical protein
LGKLSLFTLNVKRSLLLFLLIAWSKIMGNYDNADLGYIKNGLTVLTGAPIFGRRLENKLSLD